jgi:hypothetical protein
MLPARLSPMVCCALFHCVIPNHWHSRYCNIEVSEAAIHGFPIDSLLERARSRYVPEYSMEFGFDAETHQLVGWVEPFAKPIEA